MGPDELQAAAGQLCQQHGGQLTVTSGPQLTADFPLIAAVGRASPRAPRLLDLLFSMPGAPRVTLIGKGVCFDTGGLDIKPAAGMQLMKKDMGGAACVLALARLLRTLSMPIELRVLVAAVDNSIAGDAFRPGDVLRSRQGLSVEIGNTDAEGRLVLADALTLAAEQPSDLLIDLATLTGAARVALGSELPAVYSGDPSLANAAQVCGLSCDDPLWAMPLWRNYEEDISSRIADLNNAGSSGLAGSITAALFLRRFVNNPRYLHFDIYAHTPSDQPARPKGGVGQGARAVFAALPAILGL
jgi:leucyl aminopeptidase